MLLFFPSSKSSLLPMGHFLSSSWSFNKKLLLHTYKHMYTHTYIFLNITCIAYIILLVCTFSGLIFGTGQPFGAPWRRLPLPFQVFLSCLYLLVYVCGLTGFFSNLICHFFCVSFNTTIGF